MDWPEEIAVAGSTSGTIKLWDLEHAKVIRTLAGHKSNTRCVEFHPFGDFFASGSADNSVKIWDVRRKGCIQTYHGHTDAVEVMKITPDGRWITTGGADATVKIWDMTAGKLLKSYADHAGAITSLAFNPAEFMMASGGMDCVVRFYDLQTFECISTTEPSASPPKVVEFNGDGHELMVAYPDSLRIWTWEPAVCQDVIAVNWPNIADIRTLADEAKLIGGALDQNFVSMWGVDLSQSPVRPNLERRGDAVASHGSQEITSYHMAREDVIRNIGGRDLVDTGGPSAVDSPRLRKSVSASSLTGRDKRSPDDGKRGPSNSSGSRPHPGLRMSPSPYIRSGHDVSEPDVQYVPESPAGHRIRSRQGSRSADDEIAAKEAVSRSIDSFISSGNGKRPLNLDVAKFIPNAQRRNQPLLLSPTTEPPPTSDADVIDLLLFRHASLASILKSRLASIRMIREAWDETNIRHAVESMIALKDSSVWVDMLRVVNLKPKLLTLDVAVLLLPMLNELLFEVYEDYIVTACATIRVLIKSFANVILATISSATFISPGVDISREERLQRCAACHRAFGDIRAALEELKRGPGAVGATVRETLKDLGVFGFGNSG
ncbi:Katanin p80 WD40 repeat-containing subunit B1 [Borealophlyctis nickersoniae]|nr:Katanin p80 WD40 repeat-containing subunit B1 [Borealophlyctis nickersoniae]